MNTLECDLVMKGGITSGVIYPRLVTRLSEVYKFRSIGGTSAGAIAAGAAAAAQLGVSTGANPKAFEELDKLPDLLGGKAKNGKGSMLLNLFQPQPAFRRHFALLTSALNAKSKTRMGVAVAWAAIRKFPIGALLGALPGALIAWYSTSIGFVLGVVFALIGLVAGALIAAVRSLGKHLPANNFGLCNGMADSSATAEVLSQWLHGYLNRLAGKAGDEPLTFGELWAAKLRAPMDPAPHDGTKEKQIELAMITTALNIGRPFRFPFESNDLYFKPGELGKFLPAPVIAWMKAHARDSENARALSKTAGEFLALPAPEDMPVLLGVRMSLSFPILLSAIPLYTVDWTREYNAKGATKAVRLLFSDGGICSNFPVHFFDGPLPSRPTFGVNLKAFHPDHQEERVYLPPPLDNNKGIKNYIPEFSDAQGLGSVFAFVGSIMNTMQNWRDQVQIGMPGYRDRIVHVCHSDKEGGMNLNMEKEVIDALAGGGAQAAGELRQAFVPGSNPTDGAWYNHRRIRMRTLLAGIDQKLRGIQRALGRPNAPTWKDVVDDANAAYKFTSAKHREVALQILAGLSNLGDELVKSGIDLATGAPRPESEWRSTPRV